MLKHRGLVCAESCKAMCSATYANSDHHIKVFLFDVQHDKGNQEHSSFVSLSNAGWMAWSLQPLHKFRAS